MLAANMNFGKEERPEWLHHSRQRSTLSDGSGPDLAGNHLARPRVNWSTIFGPYGERSVYEAAFGPDLAGGYNSHG